MITKATAVKEKIKHKISTRHDGGEIPTRIYRTLIRQAVLVTLNSEAVDMPCTVSVLITGDYNMQKLNMKFRNINKATDVLSFPMQVYRDGGWCNIIRPDIDFDTNTVPLGDIVISTDTIRRNARKYRRSFEEETSRMIIHSTLHLLGYDHGDFMTVKENALTERMGYLND